MLELVRKIDHVYAVLDDAEAAFNFMRDDVELPVAWPYTSYGEFASGGIGLGNLNLEFVAATPGWIAQHPARLTGIAFEPALPADEALLGQLDRREIEHSPLMPTPGWTNVGLGGLGVAPFAFLCDYHFPEAKDAGRRRAALEECAGGRLAIREAAEVVVGVLSPSSAQANWQRLLDPLPADHRRWIIGSGPALRLVPHDRLEVIELKLGVDDPDVASRLWGELTADVDPLDGLPLSFTVATASA